MKILHVNAGNEYGGGLFHILTLFEAMDEPEMDLLVFEDGPVAQHAREKGIQVHVLEQSSRYDLKVLSKLVRFVKENNYDIVHTHGPRANTFLSRIYKKLPDIKWVTTIHSNPCLDFKGRGLKGKIFEWINLRALRQADYLIAVSREIREIAINNGTDASKSTVVHNGIELSPLTPTFEKKTMFKLSVVGRLEWVKGYHYLFRALEQARIKKWQLEIYGKGTEEQTLKKLAKELGIDQSIHFKGWIEKESLLKKLKESEVLVLPSISESFPLVVLEAGQSGLTVIASEVGDVKELIPTIDQGWLVPSKNVSALANALEEAYHLWEKNELVNKQRSFYEWTKQFSTEKQANETQQVYKRLLYEE